MRREYVDLIQIVLVNVVMNQPLVVNSVLYRYVRDDRSTVVFWRVDTLLRGDSVNISRCYGAPAAYAFAVTSHNRRGDASGVFSRSTPRLYDSTDRVRLSERVQCSWGFTCGVLTSGQRKQNNLHLLRFVTRKRLVKTLQRNSHCGELLPSKD
jgi:hypothetical protein